MKSKSQRPNTYHFDFLQKIIIIGDSGVGKSNILLRYSQNSFAENHMATIGLNYVFKIIPIDDVKIKLQIWDTAGQDKFKTITKNYYRNSQGVLVVFGVDCRDSFYSVQRWMEDLSDTTDEKTCILLVGNKKDLQNNREVTQQQGFELANKYGVEYIECSAKTAENVDDIFQKICKTMKVQFIDKCDVQKIQQKQGQLKIMASEILSIKCCQK